MRRVLNLPLLRFKDDCPALAVLVPSPAQDPVVARDRPRYANLCETTNLVRTLVVAALGRISWPAQQRTVSAGQWLHIALAFLSHTAARDLCHHGTG